MSGRRGLPTGGEDERVVSGMEKRPLNWTDAQLLAQRKRGNTLVSAAAGSGKTAVLIEKILRLLTVSGATLDDMLIVTYTKNAAEELKAKIAKKLTEKTAQDPLAERHLGDLPRAVIGTIHSFLLRTVKENYSALGIAPGVSVIDGGEEDTLKAAAVEETLEVLFSTVSEGESPDEMSISGVCDVIGKVSDTAETIVTVYDRLRSAGDGTEKLFEYAGMLDEYAESDFFDSPWGGIVRERLAAAVDHFRRAAEAQIPGIAAEPSLKKTVFAAEGFLELLDRIKRALDAHCYEDVRLAVRSYDSKALTVAQNKVGCVEAERFAAVKKQMVDAIVKCRDLNVSAEGVADAMKKTARFVRGFARAVGKFGEIYGEKKKERGRVDYQDLESYALKLFVGEGGKRTAIARKLGEKYKYIFVDEYQDANGVQDAIFRAIGAESERFLVGDIKQSIYRFRGAEPSVFSGYREKWESIYPSEGDGDVTEPRDAGIFMSTNFRCAEPIVDFVNLVSRRTFPYGGVPFCRDDELIFGADNPTREPVTVCLLEKEEGVPTEEEYTADTIRSMIGTDPFGTGVLRPEDFAILIPTNDAGREYGEALEARGIPVSQATGVDLAEDPGVVLALDILRAVDNPYRDGPLAGMMYSSIYGFTLDDLVSVRRKYAGGPLFSAVVRAAEDDAGDGALKEKCSSFLLRMERYRSAEKSTPANAFIEYLFAESEIMNAPEVTGRINGAERLRSLLDLARRFEDGVFGGLFGFLAYVDEKIAAGTFNASSEKGGAVRIMTVHKSKGLEFPVCFVGRTAKKYSDREFKKPVVFDRELGIGSYLPGEGGFTKYEGPVRRAIVEKRKAEDSEEQMRLLYVAMTRAKNKLFITMSGKVSTLPDDLRADEWLRDGYTVKAVDKPADHIVGAAIGAPPSVCRIDILTEKGETTDGATETAPHADVPESPAERARDAAKRASESFLFEYPFSFLSNLPSKLAVSKLYPEVLDEGETALENAGEIAPDDGEMPYPTFMTGTTDYSPAEKGTANHVFMQFCDFDRLAEGGVAEETKRLVDRGFMTPRMAELIEEDFITRFIRGELFARMKKAETVWREFRFNVRFPAGKFTADAALAEQYEKADARVTVQGVFDCVFREKDGTLVLVDYKTDAMTAYDRTHPDAFAEKLRERHKTQLSYYKEAAALIFGGEPDETLIWSLPAGYAVRIED